MLEIGTGSAYSTTLLSKLLPGGEVISLEINRKVYSLAKSNIEKYSLDNVTLINSDGKQGYRKNSPYDRILVNAASSIHPTWLSQLKENSFMVLPLKTTGFQVISKVDKYGKILQQKTTVVFVDLI